MVQAFDVRGELPLWGKDAGQVGATEGDERRPPDWKNILGM